jgi:uncharacterized membrane protein YGL010W
MTFPELLEKQWSDYPERHKNKVNLLIHIVAVPVVWLAAIQAFGALLLVLMPGVAGLGILFWALVLVGVSLFAQSRGDAMEAIKPPPFAMTKDYAISVAAEQFVTFPRFVLTGGWLKNFQAAG